MMTMQMRRTSHHQLSKFNIMADHLATQYRPHLLLLVRFADRNVVSRRDLFWMAAELHFDDG